MGRVSIYLNFMGDTEVPSQPMFWGAHWGVCCDRFGVRRIVNVADASDA